MLKNGAYIVMNTLNISSEVTFKQNPELALKRYHEVGYHVEPNLWAAQECDNLIEAAKSLPTYQDGSFKSFLQAHRVEPKFLAALKNPRIVQILELLVNGKVSAIQSQFFFCRPGTRGFVRHQDNYYVQSSWDGFASAWSALTDVDPGNGGLVVYPKVHLEPILPVEPVAYPDSSSGDPNTVSQQTVLPDRYESVDLYVPKGAVVFLHGHNVHKSHNNTTQDRFRQALLMTYIRQGEKFRPGFAAQRAEVNVYG